MMAEDPRLGAPAPQPDPARAALRAVHRAVAELRRGTPVLLRGEDHGVVMAPAETVGAAGLGEILALAKAPPVLLLAPSRAGALALPLAPPPGLRPVTAVEEAAVALRLPPAMLEPAALRSLADPTFEGLLDAGGRPERAPAPPLALAALALAKLARLLPAVVLAPLREGPMREGPMREGLARPDLLSVVAADVLAYPASAASSLRRVAEAAVPLEDAADARIVAFRAADGGIEHLAIVIGRPEDMAEAGGAPLVRLHSECFTGDLLGSLRCDCGPQLRGAIARMAQEKGGGVLLYLAQEGRGIGLVNKLRAYALQDAGLDTVDANKALGWGADERNFLVAATMLEQLGIARVRLMTNNPDKLVGLVACGVAVEGRVPHEIAPNGVNDGYLATKAARFGHLLAPQEGN
uniref:GTP cyclohydrolase II n=1 Tax=Siccirubricoccus phaeus TaxID=2595053 RepID=UPI0038B65860